MARKRTIKLLVISQSDNEGERLVSLFRNAGRVARAQRVFSAEELVELTKSDEYDLMIANDHYPDLTPEQAIDQLKKQNIDIPVLVVRQQLTDSNIDLKYAAADIVSSGDDQRLVFAANRELEHLNERRELQELRDKLTEAEHRSELLMAQSLDAVAYVADGMLISVNPPFAQRFGYNDVDDLDCLPIIDVIDTQDHERFKGVLKSQLASGEGSSEITITGSKADGESFIANFEISCASVDGETCLQLTVHEQGKGGAATASNAAASGSKKTETQQQIANLLKQTTGGATSGALAFVSIDNYASLRDQYGLMTTARVAEDILGVLKSSMKATDYAGQYCDDGLILLLSDINTEGAETLATQLCKKAEQHITEIGEQSLQCTVSIGLLELNAHSDTNTESLIDSAYKGALQVRIDNNQGGIGNGFAWFVPVKQRRSVADAGTDNDLDHVLAEAIEDGRFALLYQPIVSLRGAKGDHYEVKIVMQNDDEELSAADYMAQLQFSGINTRLDRWIIIEATKRLSEQRDKDQDIRLFINLTSHTLQDDSLLPWLNVALRASNLPPSSIIFQFDEQALIDTLKPAVAFSKQLHDIGCGLSIEGFGGVSDPLKSFNQVKANFAKLNAKFTAVLQSNGDTEPLKELIANVREVDCRIIIPEVSNAAALAQLWQMGVDFIQGDYLAAASQNMDYEFADIA